MWRRVRNLLLALDVALLAAVLGLWWHSRSAADIAALSLPPDGRTQFAASLRGQVVLAVSGFVVDDRRRWCLDWTSGSVVTGEKLFEELVKGPTVISAVGLIEYHRGRAVVGGNDSGRWWMLVLPHWMAVALLTPWPARRAWVTIRRRRRLRHGRCPECGYDLRITPGRCTECGWTSAAAGQKQRRRWPWGAVAALALAGGMYGMLRPKTPMTTRAMPPSRIVDVDIGAGPRQDALDEFCRQASLELVPDEWISPDEFPSLHLHRVDVETAVQLMAQRARIAMWLDGRRLHVGKQTGPRGREWCRVYELSQATEQIRAFEREMRAAGILPLRGAAPRSTMFQLLRTSVTDNNADIGELLCRLSAFNPWLDQMRVMGTKVIVLADATEHQRMQAAVERIEALGPAQQRRALQFDWRSESFGRSAIGGIGAVPDPNPLLRQRISLVSQKPVGLKRVLEELADLTELNVVVDFKGIKAMGIELEFPITVQFENVPWSQALDGVLAQAAGGAVKLRWLTEKNVVIVGTSYAIDQWWAVRVYDIRDIVIAQSKRGETSEKGAVGMIESRVRPVVEEPVSGYRFGFDWEYEYCGGRLYVWTSIERHAQIETELTKMRAELK